MANSKEIVMLYIDKEAEDLYSYLDKYPKYDDWIDFAEQHIYYHFLVCLEDEETAREAIRSVYYDYHDNEFCICEDCETEMTDGICNCN
jgi:hypothetical protein